MDGKSLHIPTKHFKLSASSIHNHQHGYMSHYFSSSYTSKQNTNYTKYLIYLIQKISKNNPSLIQISYLCILYYFIFKFECWWSFGEIHLMFPIHLFLWHLVDEGKCRGVSENLKMKTFYGSMFEYLKLYK